MSCRGRRHTGIQNDDVIGELKANEIVSMCLPGWPIAGTVRSAGARTMFLLLGLAKWERVGGQSVMAVPPVPASRATWLGRPTPL